MNRMTCPSVLEVVEHRLEALLELAAELGAGDQRAHVQRPAALAASGPRHLAVDDALGEPSTMAVLPTPGSPISTGLFLVRRCSTWMTAGSPRRADHRVELALLGALGQVDGVHRPP